MSIFDDPLVQRTMRNLSKPLDVYYADRLRELYDDAKRRAGASLSIYGEVSDVLDALEEKRDDAVQRAENLCGRLRLEYGAQA